MERGFDAARTLKRYGSLLSNFAAISFPRISAGNCFINSSKDSHLSSYFTKEGALGCAPIHSSAWGFVEGELLPTRSAIAVWDPHAYSWMVFFIRHIFFITL
jgi:hypothetical protein